MAKRKVLGTSIDYKDIVNFKVRLEIEYTKTSGERIKQEAEYDIQTTDKETAINLAINKARSQLAEFPYIIPTSVTIETKKRKRKTEV